MSNLKKLFKKILPRWILFFYHGLWSYLSAFFAGFPSKKLIVIGVTGTNGKSTTVALISHGLKSAGFKVASTSTVSFIIGEEYQLNKLHMTMPGRGFLANFLKKAVQENCDFAVIEVSSEGLMQNRHWGTYFDVAVFTNITPEHIISHGNFENYLSAKLTLFDWVSSRSKKILKGKSIPRVAVVNTDSEYASNFLSKSFDKKITYGLKKSHFDFPHFQGQNINVAVTGASYELNGEKINLNLKGKFDIYNSLASIAVFEALDVPREKYIVGIQKLSGVRGRLEIIQKEPFYVMVDFAHDPASTQELFSTILSWGVSKKIIHVFGSAGGGRDTSKRSILGEISAKNSDICIITSDDSYNDDPSEIIKQIAEGAILAGKILNKDLYTIVDRREAIAKAFSIASKGDFVLLSGKGAENKLYTNEGDLEWDESQIAKEELSKISK